MSNGHVANKNDWCISLLMDVPQHKSTVINWYFDAWGKRDPSNTLESYTQKLETFLQDGSIPAHLVICDGERPIATAHIRKHEIPSYVDYEMWLGGVYVDSDYRGQGVAKKVVNGVIKEAKARGIGSLYLQTEDLSGGLYAELGWKKLHQINNKGSEVIVMVKEL
ncbi:GNAT family N-acetyltransferase [Vibrio sp. 10N]|uniref:GNAT family N-acetyltransferase n=1 Tax=Vibrio sp. 10N TaxID=3058938 RepID=UPI002813A29C|nr:GNAT family N-acetyltransferase [Vibrio sp. 10N]